MFGLDFLFVSALFALPAAALPVLLHMLFRRKSPIVPFSTLRFIKMSIQQTAARRRIQRWLLLLCRVMLLLLLIWAVSQPVKKMTTGWFDKPTALIAAIVVDTSYSMQLQDGTDGQATLLSKADSVVQDLLNGPLNKAKVAIYKSLPDPKGGLESLQPVGGIQKVWTALKPQCSPQPLALRVATAMDMLSRQDAPQKWLVIISDMQRKEFPQPVAPFANGRIILFDLHPEEVRSAGVTRVAITPEQPLPGIGSEVLIEVSGQAGDQRFASLNVTKIDGTVLLTKPAARAAFDGNGATPVHFPVQLPAERWMLLTGSLQQDEPLAWAKSRSWLIETPPRQSVGFIDPPTQMMASKYMRLVLEPPKADVQQTWPLTIHRSSEPEGSDNVLVMPLTQWPDENRLDKMKDFVGRGGTLILALQPGLEQTWSKLTDKQKTVLTALLPSAPYVSSSTSAVYQSKVPTPPFDPLLVGLADDPSQFGRIAVSRFVPMAIGDPVTTSMVLGMIPREEAVAGTGAKPVGLLFRKKMGTGLIYTLSTLPESRFTSFYVHTRFLPLMVRMCLRPQTQAEARNAELGDKLVLSGPQYAGIPTLEIQGPAKELYNVKAKTDRVGTRFEFDQANEPGIYTWRKPSDPTTLALTNVQLPAAEAELTYHDGKSRVPPGENTIVIRSFKELSETIIKLTEPDPRWSLPIAVVLVLLCVEALMASIPRLWKSNKPGAAGSMEGLDALTETTPAAP